MATASDVLKIASAEVGQTNGAKYWKFVFPSYKYVNGNATPYCACFCSWVANQAKQKVDGLPGGYCPYVLNKWRSSGRLVPAKDAQPGDFVTFDWQGDGISDHIGIVEKNTGKALSTIEGNTNGGKVCRRSRAYSTISGCYRPLYDKPKPSNSTKPSTPANTEKPKPTKTVSQIADEVIAGKWGIGADRVKRLKAAGYDYDAVQRQVNAKLAAKSQAMKPTRYKVTAREGLNIRKGPGTSYKKIGALGYGTVVTVYETRNGWGRIGEGWIYLYYAKKA